LEVKKIRKITLFELYTKQVIKLAVILLLEILAFYMFYSYGMRHNIFLPASYTEDFLMEQQEQIEKQTPFSSEMIPDNCTYVLLDPNFQVVETNMKQSSIAKAIKRVKGNTLTVSTMMIVNREDGYCVIQYPVTMQFTNQKWNERIPNVELFLFLCFIIPFIIIIVFNARQFQDKLKSQLIPLYEEIETIKNHELHMESLNPKQSVVAKVKVKEIYEVLVALKEMENALVTSLKKEWEMENAKRHHMKALAHDIKTPLTIMKGNAELIKEEEELEEIYELASIIDINADKIESYIGLLMEDYKKDDRENEIISTGEITNKLVKECKQLCTSFQTKVKFSNTKDSGAISIHSDLLMRAVMNLVQNALEHTDLKKGIEMNFTIQENMFGIQIRDYGPGFSKEALQHGTKQFYTERTERSGNHYGIGMHFASEVIKNSNGNLSFYNRTKKGAIVEIKLPIISMKN